MNVANQISHYLNRFTVGIAGCGGLGSNCAVALARAGIGRLIIADFGIVTAQNFKRGYYFNDQIGRLKVSALKENIQRINPKIIVNAFDIKLCVSDIIELYRGCDIIVEAFDRAEMRHMINETVRKEMPEKTLVTGSGALVLGNLSDFTIRKFDNLATCGDEHSEVLGNSSALAPHIGIVANMQANEVINVLLKDFKPEV